MLSRPPTWREPIADDEKSTHVLGQLHERLVDLCKSFPDGLFVKLNTRSPKDAPLYDQSEANCQLMRVSYPAT